MATDNGDNADAGTDVDPEETREWLEALDGVIQNDGPGRAHQLIESLVERGLHAGAPAPLSGHTAYINTIPRELQPKIPGDQEVEHRLRAWIRWNAMAIVLRANKESSELGGHLASYQSAATLYEVGFNHFWHAPSKEHGGDLVYIQGHSSPGIYSRAFLEGRLSAEQVANFRQEALGDGLSSYPHPWLMPEFWQFPTVSMGLGPLMAIYQARYMKYLTARGLSDTEGRKVWAFMGDGEMDEPESMGAISLAGREHLDNLVFVINCNLQRLDGPVRGNGKIIQELETNFRGAGWNVIKVIWGGRWDSLLASDQGPLLVKRMEEAVDGEYQTYKARDGAYVREHFFGRYPELAKLVEDMSDEQIWALNRGGHDPHKMYAAYKAATETVGQPTLILAKTVKGYGMGVAGESQNITHQQKKVTEEGLFAFRDRFGLPLTDQQVHDVELVMPDPDSPEMNYLRERRAELGGSLPVRRPRTTVKLEPPKLEMFKAQLEPTGEREVSTTMAFVRILSALLRDKTLKDRVVPIVPDESRTFGMEGLFRQLGIFSQVGQLYQPEDADQLMFYREDPHGQILQEGINEAGAMSSWIAAATSYSNHDTPAIPFYIFYSMFGFQRIGDLAWAAGDSRARGFLLGATAGRTTLNGEGLQHEDGHSHLISATIPNCRSYDPTFAHEVAVVIQDGLRRMVGEQEDCFYYLTLMNENYSHPGLEKGAEEGILRGLYPLSSAEPGESGHVRLLGSGSILREAIAAAELLASDFGVGADVFSATSFTELRRDGLEAERWNTLHPGGEARTSWVEETLGGDAANAGDQGGGPVIAASDYTRSFAEQIRPWVPGAYRTLGTDGFGRSDYRVALRDFFEVDRRYIAVAALKALADEGGLKPAVVSKAIKKLEIDPERSAPWLT